MVRNDFVSNSSSCSFIIDAEKHGKWFNQCIEIMKGIDEGTIWKYHIQFDGKIIPEDLVDAFSYANNDLPDGEKPFVSIEKSKERIYFCSNVVASLRFISDYLKKHIVSIRCDFHDDIEAHGADYRTYEKLKATGLEFEWIR